MSTKLPRVAVRVSPELHEALAEFRRTSGMSSSSLLSNLLAETVPVIRAMTESYKLLRSNPPGAVDVMRDVMQKTLHDLGQAELELAPRKPRKIRRQVQP